MENFNVLTHYFLITVLSFGIIYSLFLNLNRKQYFISNCWLYIAYILLIIYHLTSSVLAQYTTEHFRVFCVISGAVYLNKFFVGIISGRGNRLFDKINFLVSQLSLYTLCYFIIRDRALDYYGKNDLLAIIINWIFLILIIIDIIYLIRVYNVNCFKFIKVCIVLLIINLAFEITPIQNQFIRHLINVILSFPLYLLTMIAYKKINQYEQIHPWNNGA